MSNTTEEIKRDVAAVFFDGKNLDNAIKDLLALGIAKEQVSLLCNEQVVKEKLQADYKSVNKVNDGGSMERYVENEGAASTVSATIGGLSLAGSAVGGGAIVASAAIFGGALAVATAASVVVGGIGAVVGAFISKSDADVLKNELDAGHIILLVRVGENRMKDEVVELLSGHSGMNARVLQPA